MPVNNPSSSGGDVDHVAVLPTDSRMFDDPPGDYPLGTSWMPSIDYNTEGTFAFTEVDALIITSRYHDTMLDQDLCYQTLRSPQSVDYYVDRIWNWSANEWMSFVRPQRWSAVQGKPSTFPPEVAGTPSEGDVVTYVSGVPTWAAP